MIGLLRKAFIKMLGGTRNDRIIRTRMKVVLEQINPLEPELQALSDDDLRARSLALKARRQSGEDRRKMLPEAFALIREASRRARDHRQYDVQLVAGMILDEGWIAEEATGEGKTIACYPAIYMAWLEGMHSHVVTTSDYLVQRDAEFAQPVFDLLGMSVGYIVSPMPSYGQAAAVRRENYACDVTYGTNSEFGFDYLRDNMKMSVHDQVQGPLDFVIVDEVDSILIDEARTPLIISGPAYGSTDRYKKADAVARELIRRNEPWDRANRRVENLKRDLKGLEGELDKHRKTAQEQVIRDKIEAGEEELAAAEQDLEAKVKYYDIELERKSAHMTHEGVGAAQEVAGVGSFYVGANMEWPHLMDQALRAHLTYERDKDYVVQQGRVVIVDQFTGRLMEGRQWSDGLHQAVEAKEKVQIKEETQTIATITIQNFFKMYRKLSGMTGTAMTEAGEFFKVYGLDVAAVPTNVPCVRDDRNDRIYGDTDAKYNAIVEEIREVSESGRPVLVGTTSIEKSERISQMLMRKYGIEHELLNGRPENVARESDIVALAGQQRPKKKGAKEMVGNVTIATNMAGRGTDIKLSDGAREAGGLHIVGTERHEARRIDNQLRGRSGRQGDPGSSRFFLSIRDDLMAIFAGEWTLKVLGWLGLQGDVAIEDKRISKGIERAQRKVEERNFEIRKNLLDYDEVMDVQRKTFYSMRQDVLRGVGLEELVFDMVGESIAQAAQNYLDGSYARRVIAEWARSNLQVQIEDDQVRARSLDDLPNLEDDLRGRTRDEAANTIAITLGEYMDEDIPAKEWDLRGLSQWAQSRFGVQVSQNQLRKMSPEEIEDKLVEAATERIDKVDLAPLAPMLEDSFAADNLAEWVRLRFSIEMTGADLPDEPGPAAEMLTEKVREAYRRREVEYPAEHAIEMTVAQAGTENVYALESLCKWVNHKYEADWTVEPLQGRDLRGIYQDLVKLSEQWMLDGKLDAYVREQLGDQPKPEVASDFCEKRFHTRVTPERLAESGDIAGQVVAIGRRFLRREMTELERFVLLQILDGAWKDHLLNMDHLKGSIGLRGYAEQDPKVAYKREGGRLFEDMFTGVREKVTEMIFKVRLAAEEQVQSVYEVSNQVHEQLQGYDHLAQEMQADQQAAAQAGKAKAVEQIVRDTPKVGRNDPCPCGSGKKYKKCCGAS